MSLAVFRIMLLGLVRDRAALAMSFLVPAAFFLVFATIFSMASREDPRVTIAIADELHSELSAAIVHQLRQSPSLNPTGGAHLTAEGVRELVRQGSADAGLIIGAAREASGAPHSGDAPSMLVVSDPVRGIAARILTGHVRQAMSMPLRPGPEMQPESSPGPNAGSTHEGTGPGQANGTVRLPGAGAAFFVEREDVTGRSAKLNHVAYYAGAVAVLFLLFSAVHGAVTLLEEDESGILDRVLAGPGSTVVLVNGKFLYLVVQGFVQIGVIFGVAMVVHGVDLIGHWWPWTLTTLAASAAAAGLALALATACTTRRQAQTFANVVILVLSAIGGSMVPRFLMPPYLQDLGWLTPNTWALEAYTAIFWRDEPISALLEPLSILGAAAVLGLLVAQRLARRLQFL